MITIAFDLDGTLVDSHQDIAEAVNDVLTSLGLKPQPMGRVKAMIGHGVGRLLEQAFEGRATEAHLVEARARFASAYESRLLATTKLYAGIPEALEAMSRAGLRLALATNKPRRFTEPIVRAFDLTKLGIVGWASADEVEQAKPSPEVLRLALDRAGSNGASPAQVAYVGDMPVDVETARLFGARSVGVLWGFDPAGLIAARPDHLVATPAALEEEWTSTNPGEKGGSH